MKLLSKNSKMKKSGGARFNFGIIASKLNCPMAGTCAKLCFAKKGTYQYPVVTNAYTVRKEITLQDNFIQLLQNEIDNKRKITHLRIHDSGDFYSLQYAKKWVKLAYNNPGIHFYAYTKMITMFKYLQEFLPINFTVVYSYGGLQDRFINPEIDRHAKIFQTETELLDAGYMDASHDDSIAHDGKSNKIGLVIH